MNVFIDPSKSSLYKDVLKIILEYHGKVSMSKGMKNVMLEYRMRVKPLLLHTLYHHSSDQYYIYLHIYLTIKKYMIYLDKNRIITITDDIFIKWYDDHSWSGYEMMESHIPFIKWYCKSRNLPYLNFDGTYHSDKYDYDKMYDDYVVESSSSVFFYNRRLVIY